MRIRPPILSGTQTHTHIEQKTHVNKLPIQITPGPAKGARLLCFGPVAGIPIHGTWNSFMQLLISTRLSQVSPPAISPALCELHATQNLGFARFQGTRLKQPDLGLGETNRFKSDMLKTNRLA